MARRIPFEASDSLSRKRTADLLRKLRALNKQVKMLKVRLDAEEETERRPRNLRPRPKRQPN
jgi:hypothetical protein